MGLTRTPATACGKAECGMTHGTSMIIHMATAGKIHGTRLVMVMDMVMDTALVTATLMDGTIAMETAGRTEIMVGRMGTQLLGVERIMVEDALLNTTPLGAIHPQLVVLQIPRRHHLNQPAGAEPLPRSKRVRR